MFLRKSFFKQIQIVSTKSCPDETGTSKTSTYRSTFGATITTLGKATTTIDTTTETFNTTTFCTDTTTATSNFTATTTSTTRENVNTSDSLTIATTNLSKLMKTVI